MKSIEKNGKVFMVAYDQGMEHGPVDFSEQNYHPNYILKIALESGASCVTMNYGLAKHFYRKELKNKLPLVLKLSGKTALYSKNEMPALIANVEEAVSLGAQGIGYTLFPGSVSETAGFEQFALIRREAEKRGLVTILWSYARGPEIKDQYDPQVVSYAVRVAAELGADYVKVKYPGRKNLNKLKQQSLVTKVLISGTGNFGDDYLGDIKSISNAGLGGLAVGRKLWQHKDPVKFGKEIAFNIYSD